MKEQEIPPLHSAIKLENRNRERNKEKRWGRRDHTMQEKLDFGLFTIYAVEYFHDKLGICISRDPNLNVT